MIAKLAGSIVVFALLAHAADPPAPVIALFRSAAEELATPDAELFFDHFDKSMPGFQSLKSDVEGLLIYGYIVSTIEFSADAGDDQKRELEIDWLWRQNGGPQKRAIVKCTIERRGKEWKIVKFEPLDFFRR